MGRGSLLPRIIPLMVDGEVDAIRFEDAIKYNGRGRQWFKHTVCDSTIRDSSR
jgi:hypothetical protein